MALSMQKTTMSSANVACTSYCWPRNGRWNCACVKHLGLGCGQCSVVHIMEPCKAHADAGHTAHTPPSSLPICQCVVRSKWCSVGRMCCTWDAWLQWLQWSTLHALRCCIVVSLDLQSRYRCHAHGRLVKHGHTLWGSVLNTGRSLSFFRHLLGSTDVLLSLGGFTYPETFAGFLVCALSPPLCPRCVNKSHVQLHHPRQ